MSLSFLVPNRTVLLVSDDALYIYASSSKNVQLIEAVPWDAPNFSENVANIISKDCGKKPVLLLNDMVEQHYRKERVIKSGVNALDRSTMLKRRLSIAFGKYAVRAALPLKEKLPKVTGQPAASLYIFAALSDTEQLDKSMDAVRKSMASVAGLGLLPVESANMVKTLSAKYSHSKIKPVWNVLVGYHRSGYLRQVVTKNGELALTRMSPFTADVQDAGAWSQEVQKELKSTMSYLSRFGYAPEQGLDVNIIAPSHAHQALESYIEEDFQLNIMTAHTAASHLGVRIGANADEGFADVLHVAWAARKSRLTLPMKAGRVDAVHKPRQIAMAATILLVLGLGFLSYQLLNLTGQASEIYSDIDDLERRKVQLDSQYQAEMEKKQKMGFDVRLVQSSISVYDQLESKNIPALDLFKGIGKGLGRNLRIDKVRVAQGSASPVSRMLPGAMRSAEPVYEARLTMTYPGTTNIDQGNKEVADLRDRLSKALKSHTVQVTKFLKDYEYTEGLVVETGDLDKENLQQDFVAEILIKGPVLETEGGAQ